MKQKIKLVFLFIVYFGYSIQLTAQIKPATFPTPNAAGLGTFGQIPVSTFNGLPNINIPLYELKGKHLSLPVSLAYHAGGVRVAQHGSWTGVNWSLEAGGVITRIRNDLHDEYVEVNNNYAVGHYYRYAAFNNNSNWGTAENIEEYEDCCFTKYRNQSNLLVPRYDRAADEFAFNFMGMSGSIMLGQDGNWKLKSKQEGLSFKVEVAAPGPYQFGYPNAANRDASEPTKPNQTRLKNIFTRFTLTGPDGIRYQFGGTPTSIEFNRIDKDGNREKDAGVIATSWYLTKITSPYGDEIVLDYERKGYQIIINSSSQASAYEYDDAGGKLFTNFLGIQTYILDPVYLKSITSSNGSIEFSASRSKELDYYSSYRVENHVMFGACDYAGNFYRLWEVYCHQLSQIGDDKVDLPVCINQEGQCLSPASKWFQLDQITIRRPDNQVLKQFAFEYTRDPATRLFLLGIQESSGTGTLAKPAYKFDYYGTDLPHYLSYQVDHWGYYNGQSALEDVFIQAEDALAQGRATLGFIRQGTIFPSVTFMSRYQEKRAPNFTYMVKGSLKQITYPTGGTSEFVYQPHSYAKTVNSEVSSRENNGFTVNRNTVDKIAGGLRIYQIINRGLYNTPDVTKTYHYVEDYVNQNLLSSGVLSSSEPQYLDQGNVSNRGTKDDAPESIQYKFWYSNNILPMHNTNGNHVTYTKVVEVDSDGGFTEHTYSNHDNGYPDKVAQLYIFGSKFDFWLLPANSNELERGLLLTKKVYRGDKQILKETQYSYNSNPDRFGTSPSQHVRYIRSTPKLIDVGAVCSPTSCLPYYNFYIQNAAAMVFYTHFPYLERVREITYDQNNPSLRTEVTTSFLKQDESSGYNPFRLPKEIHVSQSDNTELVTRITYPTDYMLSDPTAGNIEEGAIMLFNQYRVNQVLEKYQYKQNTDGTNAQVVSGAVETFRKSAASTQQVVPFQTFKLETFAPLSTTNFESKAVNNRFVMHNQYRAVVTANRHDANGNLLEFAAAGDVSTVYLWGYNNTFPVAEIKNATYNQVKTALGLSNTNEDIDLGAGGLNDALQRSLRSALPGALVSTFAYDPAVGMTSKTDPAGVTTRFEYDVHNRLKFVKDQNGNITRAIDYRYRQ